MCANFATIYNNILNEIVDIGVAKELVELEYTNGFRNTIESKDSFGYKVTYEIKDYNYCLVVDEFSSNIS